MFLSKPVERKFRSAISSNNSNKTHSMYSLRDVVVSLVPDIGLMTGPTTSVLLLLYFVEINIKEVSSL